MTRTGLLALAALLATASFEPSHAEDWKSGFADSPDGTQIAYYVLGNLKAATPLLVVSGGPGSDHRYMRVGGSFARLAANRAVIMFDQRGTSKSGPVSGEPKLRQWTEDVEAVRQTLKAPSLHLLGHSFGGLVVMDYARRFPTHIASMALVDSTAATLAGTQQLLADVFPDRVDRWREVRQNLTPRFKASDIEVFTRMEFVDPDARDRFLAAIAGYTYNIEVNNALRVDLAGQDFSDTLASFHKPALVVHGRFDAIIAPATSWELHQALPSSRLAMIERAGHLPFAERPAAFVEAVETFLDAAESP
ncbi:MAG: alpha/beta hydrolase [Pseudomonadota bacterium]